jgi:hypothetical protein
MKQGSLRKRAWGNSLRALLLVFGVGFPGTASALVVSNTANVTLNASLNAALSVSVTSGSTVNFTLVNGAVANGDVPVVISTRWNVNPGKIGGVSLYGYFNTPAQALTDGGSNFISTARVQGRMTTGIPTNYTAFTQTNAVGPAGGSIFLFNERVTGANKNKTRVDNLDLRINLTGQTLPAATYTGTLHIQAVAL